MDIPDRDAPPPATATASPTVPERPAPRDAWWVWLVGHLQHEPTHALTLAYLAISLLGVWASYWFFRSFGIPILDYMDPSDYVTLGLRDPMYALLVLAAWVFILALTWRDRLHARDPERYAAVRERHRWARLWLREDPNAVSRWMQKRIGWPGLSPTGALVGGAIYTTLVFTMFYVERKAEAIKAGGGHPVRLTVAHTHEAQPGAARLLGTLGDFVFLYWPAERRAEAVSVENAARIESVPVQAPAPVAAHPAQ